MGKTISTPLNKGMRAAKVRFNTGYNIDFQGKDECVHIEKGAIFNCHIDENFAYIKVLGDDVKVSIGHVDIMDDTQI